MVNTSIGVFSEKEGKKAEFIAYLTDRAPYFDASEQKYLLLTREKISEYIRKANSEGDDLKALELLETAKNSFKAPSPIEFARIISKSIRVPGDMHLKFLAQEFAQHPSGEGIAVSDAPREIIMANMAVVLEELKKLDGVNKEKLQQIERTFNVWKKSTESKIHKESIAVKEQTAKTYGEAEGDSDEPVAVETGYRMVLSDRYVDYVRYNDSKFFGALRFLIPLEVRKKLEKTISADNAAKIISHLSVDFEGGKEVFLDVPGDYQDLNPAPGKKNGFFLSFRIMVWICVNDDDILKKEIGEDNYWTFVKQYEDNLWLEDRGEAPFFEYVFGYEAPLTIDKAKVSFKDIPLSEENKDPICEEIVKDLCAEYTVSFCDIDAVNAKVIKLVEKEDFENAEVLKRQIVDFQRVEYLAGCLAESLLDVLKTSKVVTYTMSAGLLGLFEAYRDDLLGFIKTKKAKKEAVQ